MIKNIASLSDKKVADIMTTRPDIVAINKDASLEEIKKTVVLDGHTRIPVFGENLDEILGFIHSKDLSKFLCKEDNNFALQDIIRKILFIPGSMKVVDLLLKMRNQRVHIAIVMDEYGGVDGLVTIENVMEEIVGEIEDEHDLPSDNIFFKIKKIDERTTHVGGRVEIERIEKILGVKLRKRDEEFETVGGLMTFLFNEIPAIGEEIKRDKINFKILDSDSRSVKLIEFKIA
jgi:CBS domain containing-hemolysin-like protein